jgi:hypothetical protein
MSCVNVAWAFDGANNRGEPSVVYCIHTMNVRREYMAGEGEGGGVWSRQSRGPEYTTLLLV